MPKFRVLKGHDAYAMYETIIEAESIDQANDFAYADKFADIWTPTGETREFDEVNVLVDETEEVPDDTQPVAEESCTMTVSLAQRDTILAGLRALQDIRTMEGGILPDQLAEIATNGDQHPVLTDEQIDELCEAIND